MNRASSGRTLRILRIASDLYPDVVGGIGLHVHGLSRDQAAMGHDVTVLTSDHGDRDRPRTEYRDGYRIRRLREVGAPLGNSVTPGLVTALHRLADRFDIVHAHSHLFLSSNVAAAYARLAGVPLVLTNHGVRSQTASRRLQDLFLPTVGHATFEAARLVFCYTETDRQRLRDLGVGTDVAVVPNGIDCTMFTPAAHERSSDAVAPSSKNGGSETILYVGRFSPGKRVEDVVRAVARLVDTRPDCELWLVGDGPTRPDVMDLVRQRGLQSRVTCYGTVANDQLPEIYAASDVFVLPSRSEGVPRTVLEAMASGLPVVVSDLPQYDEIVGDAGSTVPLEHPARIAAAVGDLLDDEEKRARMGAAARRRVEQSHSWADTARETTQAYYDVL